MAQRRPSGTLSDVGLQTLHRPSISHGGREALLVPHMAVLSGKSARNTLAAVRECFDSGAARIEIDIHSLDGSDYAVFHDRRLETETTGSGSIGLATPDGIRAVRWLTDPEGRPPLLSEIIELAQDCDTELQLDWKDWRLISDARLQALVELLQPVRDRVIVSTGQDWNLRRLRDAAPEVPFGFDPGHYLEYGIEGADVFLPKNMGAYGYRDDHPLAVGRVEPVADYVGARMEALALQVPGAREYFLNYRMVLQMLDDDFNPAAWLHERGVGANVWTPDYRGPDSIRMMQRLLEAGVDRITTNTVPAWQQAFAAK